MTKLSNQTLKAKALYESDENMVAFFKVKGSSNWLQSADPTFTKSMTEYFVCHESNKEACLHWLNGGAVLKCTIIEDVDLAPCKSVNMVSMMNMFIRQADSFKIKPSAALDIVKKHKHAAMIGMKANNMNLVTLVKPKDSNNWGKTLNQRSLNLSEDCEYFLCHENHVKEALHWLNNNGGVVGIDDHLGTESAIKMFCNMHCGFVIESEIKTYVGIYRVDGVGLIIGDECSSKDDVPSNKHLLKIIEL